MEIPLIGDENSGIWKVQKLKPVTFLHADNMAFLRWMKSELMYKYFHLAIVDPPYGIDAGKLNFGSMAAERTDEWKEINRSTWDSEVPDQEYWDLLTYVSRNIIAWGGNYFTKELDWSGRCFGLWDKGTDKMSFAFGELALTTFDRNPFRIAKPRNSKGEDDGDKRHRTQKPVYIYDYLHLNFVEKNQRVLDTHGGSFTHAIAASKNNINLTIMDREERYFNDGVEAYKQGTVKGRFAF